MPHLSRVAKSCHQFKDKKKTIQLIKVENGDILSLVSFTSSGVTSLVDGAKNVNKVGGWIIPTALAQSESSWLSLTIEVHQK